MATYKCEFCEQTFDQADFDHSVEVLSREIEGVLPGVHEARTHLGLDNNDLSAQAISWALLKEHFSCAACFIEMNSSTPFFDYVKGIIENLDEVTLTEVDLFDWEEVEQ